MLSLKYLQRTLCNNAPSLKSPNESLRWIDVTWVASCFAKCHAWTPLKSIFSENSPPFLVGGEWSCFLWFFLGGKNSRSKMQIIYSFQAIGIHWSCILLLHLKLWSLSSSLAAIFGLGFQTQLIRESQKKTSCSNWNTMEKSREKAQFCFFFGGVWWWLWLGWCQFSCDWTCFFRWSSPSLVIYHNVLTCSRPHLVMPKTRGFSTKAIEKQLSIHKNEALWYDFICVILWFCWSMIIPNDKKMMVQNLSNLGSLVLPKHCNSGLLVRLLRSPFIKKERFWQPPQGISAYQCSGSHHWLPQNQLDQVPSPGGKISDKFTRHMDRLEEI